MKRVMNVLPTLGIVAYMVAGQITDFRVSAMRPVTLVLLFVIVPTVLVLTWRGLASAVHISFAVFVGFAWLGFWLWPDALGVVLARVSAALLFLVLFMAAAVPPLLGREPFTEHFARQRTPEAVWTTEPFKRINLNMTWAWAGIFACCQVFAVLPGTVLALASPVWRILLQFAVPLVLMLGVGLPLSRYYPDYYMRKLGMQPVGTGTTEPAAEPPLPAYPPEAADKEKTMDGKPDVVAVNGSPHESFGNTSLMVGMLRDNLSREGLTVEEIFLNSHDVRYCQGCALCLEKGNCWIKDDHKSLVTKVLEAKAVILATPVYFFNVTAQMKTFLDRSLRCGHRPTGTWKPGIAVSVSAGWGETTVAQYLSQVMRAFGAYSVGELTAIGIGPGGFVGKEAVEARAADLARDLATAIRERRRYPATDRDLSFWHFMGNLVKENREVMVADHRHWEQTGLYDSFEAYVGQSRAPRVRSPEMRKEWIKELIRRQKDKTGSATAEKERPGPHTAKSARELLEMMPLGLNPEAAKGLSVTYQFEVSNGESFSAYVRIENEKASFHEGQAKSPDVIVKTPADVWLAIGRGEMDGAQAFMSGKYTAEGDVTLLMKLKSLFSR